MTKPLLLVQPLKLDDIKINLFDDEELQPQPMIEMIDDVELLAILGYSQPPQNVKDDSLLDWDDMPELSETEEDTYNNKRKHSDDEDEEDEDDVFAQFDFEEVYIPPPTNKKLKLDQQQVIVNSSLNNIST